MKTIFASVSALGLMASAALAEPIKLTETGMDQVRAGQLGATQLDEITAAGGLAVAITCADGRCQRVESRGPIAAVACVNGQCEVIR
jgi:hypothetical protein